jgi:hypothetical protein
MGPVRLCWKQAENIVPADFFMREKYCFSWKNKLKSMNYKSAEQGHDVSSNLIWPIFNSYHLIKEKKGSMQQLVSASYTSYFKIFKQVTHLFSYSLTCGTHYPWSQSIAGSGDPCPRAVCTLKRYSKALQYEYRVKTAALDTLKWYSIFSLTLYLEWYSAYSILYSGEPH